MARRRIHLKWREDVDLAGNQGASLPYGWLGPIPNRQIRMKDCPLSWLSWIVLGSRRATSTASWECVRVRPGGSPCRTFASRSTIESAEKAKDSKIAMSCLDNGRYTVASGATGLIRASLEASIKYANERRAFGREIAKFQLVQQKIARMVQSYEMARLALPTCRLDEKSRACATRRRPRWRNGLPPMSRSTLPQKRSRSTARTGTATNTT